MMSTSSDEELSLRGSMNYVPGKEVWTFNFNSVLKVYATTSPTSKLDTISIDCNLGIRQGNKTIIDKSQATVTFQLDALELMDFNAFLIGVRSAVTFTRSEKSIRLERQIHIPTHQSDKISPIPEYKIYLTANSKALPQSIAMSLLQNRVACIAALSLSQLTKQHKGILPPEMVLASVRNFQPANTGYYPTVPPESAPKPIAPSPTITSNATTDEINKEQSLMARTPPKPRSTRDD